MSIQCHNPRYMYSYYPCQTHSISFEAQRKIMHNGTEGTVTEI